MKSLRDSLKEWTDIDVAQYELAKRLGLINENATFQDSKYLWWSDNPVGNATVDLLEEMVDAGMLDHRTEPDQQYRWAMKALEKLPKPPKEATNLTNEIKTIKCSIVHTKEREPFIITDGNPTYMTDKELEDMLKDATADQYMASAEIRKRAEKRASTIEHPCQTCEGLGQLFIEEVSHTCYSCRGTGKPHDRMTDEELRTALHSAVEDYQRFAGESSKRSKAKADQKERDRVKTLEEQGKCLACDGEGWLWGHELTTLNYGGDHDYSSDDQRYTCDQCGGSGLKKEEDDLDSFISTRTKSNPDFPKMVEAAQNRRAKEEEIETIPHQQGCQGPGGCQPGCPHEGDPYA